MEERVVKDDSAGWDTEEDSVDATIREKSEQSPGKSMPPRSKRLHHKKNVSFFDISSDVAVSTPNDIFSVMFCGTHMVKIRSNVRLYERYFWLDESTASIHWEPSKKDFAALHLACIKEVRWGQTTDSFKTADPEGTLIGKNDIRRDYIQESRKCFSIVYTKTKPNLESKAPTSVEYGVLDLMVDSVELAEIWVLGLTLLMMTKLEREPVKACRDLIDKVEQMRSTWLAQVYHQKIQQAKNQNKSVSEDGTVIDVVTEPISVQDVDIDIDPGSPSAHIESDAKDPAAASEEPHLSLAHSIDLLQNLIDFTSYACAKNTLIQCAVRDNIKSYNAAVEQAILNGLLDPSFVSEKLHEPRHASHEDRRANGKARHAGDAWHSAQTELSRTSDASNNSESPNHYKNIPQEKSNSPSNSASQYSDSGSTTAAQKNARDTLRRTLLNNSKHSEARTRHISAQDGCLPKSQYPLPNYLSSSGAITTDHITLNSFADAYRSLANRRAFLSILIRHSSSHISGNSTSSKSYPLTMSAADLQFFLETEQNIASVTMAQCEALIKAFEPVRQLADKNLIGVDGFMRLLRSADWCSLFNPIHSAPLIRRKRQPTIPTEELHSKTMTSHVKSSKSNILHSKSTKSPTTSPLRRSTSSTSLESSKFENESSPGRAFRRRHESMYSCVSVATGSGKKINVEEQLSSETVPYLSSIDTLMTRDETASPENCSALLTASMISEGISAVAESPAYVSEILKKSQSATSKSSMDPGLDDVSPLRPATTSNTYTCLTTAASSTDHKPLANKKPKFTATDKPAQPNGMPYPPTSGDDPSSYQQMNLPLYEYLINASYQTYLSQDQQDPSCSLDSYRAVISRGARFCHLDIFPVYDAGGKFVDCEVRHIDTYPGDGLQLSQVLETIGSTAFLEHRFPMILWIEVHAPYKVHTAYEKQAPGNPHLQGMQFDDTMPRVPLTPDVFEYIYTQIDQKLSKAVLTAQDLTEISSTAEPNNNSSPAEQLNLGNNGFDSIAFHPLPSPAQLQQRILISSRANSPLLQNDNFASLVTLPMFTFRDLGIEISDIGSLAMEVSSQSAPSAQNSPRQNQSTSKSGGSGDKKSYCSIVWERSAALMEALGSRLPVRKNLILAITEEEASMLLNRRMLSQVTECRLTLVCPSISRQDSSNPNPQAFWQRGVQIVSVNHQTAGLMMDLNEAKFLQNKSSGYVARSYGWNCCQTGLNGQIINLEIISGIGLSRPKNNESKGYGIDPYVVVEMYGPGCGVPHFLDAETSHTSARPPGKLIANGGKPAVRKANKDNELPQISGELISSVAYCEQRRTKTVKNCGAACYSNGEEVELVHREEQMDTSQPGSGFALFQHFMEFDVDHPQSSILRFVVLDDEPIGDSFIGQFAIPVACIRPGYRWLPLRTLLAESIVGASLLIRVSFQPYKQVITETGDVLQRDAKVQKNNSMMTNSVSESLEERSQRLATTDAASESTSARESAAATPSKSDTVSIASTASRKSSGGMLSTIRRASQSQLMPNLLRRRSSLKESAREPVALQLYVEDQTSNSQFDSLARGSTTSAATGQANNQATITSPINSTYLSGINFHQLLPGEVSTMPGYCGYGLCQTDDEIGAFDVAVAGEPAMAVVKKLNGLLMDFRAGVSLIRHTLGFTSDYEECADMRFQGPMLMTLCSRLADYNRYKKGRDVSGTGFQCIVHWPPETAHNPVPRLIISGQSPNSSCRLICDRLEEVLFKSMRNILAAHQLPMHVLQLIERLKQATEDALPHARYATRKTVNWNIVYLESLIHRLVSTQRDIAVLLKFFKSCCKQVYVDGDGTDFARSYESGKKSISGRSESFMNKASTSATSVSAYRSESMKSKIKPRRSKSFHKSPRLEPTLDESHEEQRPPRNTLRTWQATVNAIMRSKSSKPI